MKTISNTELLMGQIQLEIGEDVEFNELPKEHSKMLAQKYGLIPPQLTASEKHLTTKEERNGFYGTEVGRFSASQPNT
jgi:hypothetical protein